MEFKRRQRPHTPSAQWLRFALHATMRYAFRELDSISGLYLVRHACAVAKRHNADAAASDAVDAALVGVVGALADDVARRKGRFRAVADDEALLVDELRVLESATAVQE